MTVISRTFLPVARQIAALCGFPDLRIAEIAHPVGAATIAEVEAKADRTREIVVAGFSQGWPAPKADSAAVGDASWSEMIEIPSGDDPFTALNDYMSEMKWSDGLPVIPPTRSLVERMVVGSGLDPDKVIATLPPADGYASIWRIAANAVMAGCRPEYLPVVVAAIEAVADPAYGLSHRQITTHAGAPLIIVNGPITERLEINSRTGVFGPGFRPNATIGRALRLVLTNIGGSVPGITDMSQTGHPGKFTYCIAEDEADSPFEPLHVERGFDVGQSVVTVINAEAPHSVTDNVNTTARGILDTCASTLAALGSNNVYSQGEPILALGPEHAAYIAAEGWTKGDVRLYIYEAARQPWPMVRDRGKSLGPKFPKWLERPNDNDMVPIVTHPDELVVITCGGAGGKSMAIPTAGRQSRAVSRLIDVPGGGA